MACSDNPLDGFTVSVSVVVDRFLCGCRNRFFFDREHRGNADTDRETANEQDDWTGETFHYFSHLGITSRNSGAARPVPARLISRYYNKLFNCLSLFKTGTFLIV